MASPPQSPNSATPSYAGTRDNADDTSQFNQIAFVVRQILARSATTTLVQVKKVTNAGGISAVGFVDVQPMVHQIDGNGDPTPHGIIHNIPYLRLQGGTSAVIIDPVVGDIGMASFASHDISQVKRTKKPANPGSRRRFDWADGLYHGGMLNGTPSQYIAFSANGITINTAQNLVISAHNAQLDASGNLVVLGAVVAGATGADQVSLQTHRHGTGAAAAGTVVPTPGT